MNMTKTGLYFKKDGSWVSAYTRYGISLGVEAMSKLLTPPPHKEPVQNKNMAMHGTSIKGAVGYKDVRTLSLPLHICASSESDFLDKYDLLAN